MLLVGDNEGLQNYFAGKKGDEAVQELVVLLYAILSGNTPI
jgi:hypothetical protein